MSRVIGVLAVVTLACALQNEYEQGDPDNNLHFTMTCCTGNDQNKNELLKSGRSVTDFLWLILLMIFFFGMVFIAAFSYVYGDPLRLIYGYDSFGNVCGVKNEPLTNISNSGLDHTDRKYVFFFNLQNLQTSIKICVHQCPSRTLQSYEDLRSFAKESGSFLCRYELTPDQLSSLPDHDNSFGLCPDFPIYASSPVLNRCIPKSVVDLAPNIIYDIHGYLNSMDLFQQILSDVYASWRELIILAAVSCIVASVMILMIHFLVDWVFCILAVSVGIAFTVGTALLWWTYLDIKNQLDAMSPDEMLEEMVQNERAFLAYSIIASIITCIILLLICCIRKQVSRVALLFEEAANCMFDLPCLFFLPVWTVIILFGFFVFWLSVILNLATAFHPTRQEIVVQKVNSTLPLFAMPPSETSSSSLVLVKEFTLINYVDPTWVRYMWWYYAIALIWISEFILSCQQMVMAGSIAKWYYAEDKELLHCPIRKEITKLITYHLGSVAKGAALITLFKFPRIILTFIKVHLYNSDNTCKKCCSTCCCCCLWWWEKCLKYINHNAYTVIAVDGCDFCPAAFEAFDCLARNAATVVTLNSMGDFILFLAKCLVTAVTGIIGLFIMKHNPNLHFYAVPIFISCVFAFFIAHCVLSLFEMIVDTVTLCYCEQSDYAPDTLKVVYKKLGENGTEFEMQELNTHS